MNKVGVRKFAFLMVLIMMMSALFQGGLAFAASVTPTLFADQNTPKEFNDNKIDSPTNVDFVQYGTTELYYKVSEDRTTLDWMTSPSAPITGMILMKGGNNYYQYVYHGETQDSGLISPPNNGGNTPAISHVCFVPCITGIEQGNLTITKTVTIPEGSELNNSDVPVFKITVTGPDNDTTAVTKEFTYPDGLVQTWNLLPGNYTVTEENPGSSWEMDVPNGPVTVSANNSTITTVTNTYVPSVTPPSTTKGSLEVTKTIVTTTGSPTNPDFSITITGPSHPNGNTKTFNDSNGLVQQWTDLIPGDYTVTETDLASWTESVPAAAIPVVSGATATVGVTNTYVPETSSTETTTTPPTTETPPTNNPPTNNPPSNNNGNRTTRSSTSSTPEVISISEVELPQGAPIPEVVIPQGAPTPKSESVDEPEMEILENEIPQGVVKLPKTGELPVELFYGIGGILTALGAFIKRK